MPRLMQGINGMDPKHVGATTPPLDIRRESRESGVCRIPKDNQKLPTQKVKFHVPAPKIRRARIRKLQKLKEPTVEDEEELARLLHLYLAQDVPKQELQRQSDPRHLRKYRRLATTPPSETPLVLAIDQTSIITPRNICLASAALLAGFCLLYMLLRGRCRCKAAPKETHQDLLPL